MISHESEIVRKLRLIEGQKAELIGSLAGIFHALAKTGGQSLAEALGAVIINCYVLARRLGIDFSQLDEAVCEKLEQNIKHGSEIEKWYGDLSELKRYLRQKR